MEEIKKIVIAEKEYHIGGTSKINWTNTSNMDEFIVSGVYICEDGERTNTNDNLPIANYGGGHNFSFVLQVSASSYTNTFIVGQTLSLSNRIGKETKQYIRTRILNEWTPWRETTGVKTLGDAGMVDKNTLDSTTEWGEYTGVLHDNSWYNSASMHEVFMKLFDALANQDATKLYGSSIYYAPFNCNLLGATFKMSVFHNSSFTSALKSFVPSDVEGGSAIKGLVDGLGELIVQKLDVIPFNPIANAQNDYFDDILNAKLQPRTIIRYGNQKDGQVKWGPFYEMSGDRSNLQIDKLWTV